MIVFIHWEQSFERLNQEGVFITEFEQAEVGLVVLAIEQAGLPRRKIIQTENVVSTTDIESPSAGQSGEGK